MGRRDRGLKAQSLAGEADSTHLSRRRLLGILERARSARILVVGDLMLDHFVWGNVRRISPEAPVPVVEFSHQSFMPGGAANVARNVTSLESHAELFGLVGRDESAQQLKALLTEQRVGCAGILADSQRPTSVKTRIIAHQQQLVRLDREAAVDIGAEALRRLKRSLVACLDSVDAVIVGDYGKGTISQPLLDFLKRACRDRGIWLSLDPKPVHKLDLTGLSLITPNRKEAFELAGIGDSNRRVSPLEDSALMSVAEKLLAGLKPEHLLITLGDQGMLLCQPDRRPFHIPTVAQEVFDVSGAGDTVIGSFTLAVAAGATPAEAAVISNHAAGVVVGKLGTATLTQRELVESFKRDRATSAARRS